METSEIATEKPSKSALKRAMHELQALGAELVALNANQLQRLELPDNLREAVSACQRIRQHGARRRQLQYIGRLMRDVDAEAIRAALEDIRGVSAAANARFYALERLRERLLADETVIGEIAATHPQADLQQLRQLRRNVLKERELGKPPRAYRELFRVLRELYER